MDVLTTASGGMARAVSAGASHGANQGQYRDVVHVLVHTQITTAHYGPQSVVSGKVP